MRTRILLITTILFAVFANLRAQVVFNATNFPDAEFRRYLIDTKGWKLGQTLTKNDLTSFPWFLSIYYECFTNNSQKNYKILNFKGAEHFTTITKFSYQIASDFPAKTINLTSFKSLEELTVTSIYRPSNSNYPNTTGPMTNDVAIDVSTLTKLKDLTIGCQESSGSMHLSSLKLPTSAPNLKKLDLLNILKYPGTLDVSKYTALEDLSLSDIGLTQSTVNTSTLTSLKRLQILNEKNLTSVNLAKNVLLDHIYFNNLGISSLNLSNNTNLVHIQAKGCPLTSLDLSKLAKLYSHYIDGYTYGTYTSALSPFSSHQYKWKQDTDAYYCEPI